MLRVKPHYKIWKIPMKIGLLEYFLLPQRYSLYAFIRVHVHVFNFIKYCASNLETILNDFKYKPCSYYASTYFCFISMNRHSSAPYCCG